MYRKYFPLKTSDLYWWFESPQVNWSQITKLVDRLGHSAYLAGIEGMLCNLPVYKKKMHVLGGIGKKLTLLFL